MEPNLRGCRIEGGTVVPNEGTMVLWELGWSNAAFPSFLCDLNPSVAYDGSTASFYGRYGAGDPAGLLALHIAALGEERFGGESGPILRELLGREPTAQEVIDLAICESSPDPKLQRPLDFDDFARILGRRDPDEALSPLGSPSNPHRVDVATVAYGFVYEIGGKACFNIHGGPQGDRVTYTLTASELIAYESAARKPPVPPIIVPGPGTGDPGVQATIASLAAVKTEAVAVLTKLDALRPRATGKPAKYLRDFVAYVGKA